MQPQYKTVCVWSIAYHVYLFLELDFWIYVCDIKFLMNGYTMLLFLFRVIALLALLATAKA